jgi:excisionase family DNA binding protein
VTYATPTMASHEGVAEVAPVQPTGPALTVLAPAGPLLGCVDEATRARMPPHARESKVRRDLSPSEAADQTGLSRTLIYREIERGHLRAYRVGGRLRITPEALAEWKQLHAVVPRAQASYEPRPATSRGGREPDSFAAELRAIREGRAA